VGHAFPKLRLKAKADLISLRGGMAALPVTDPAQRATPLAPAAWRDMLATAQPLPSVLSAAAEQVRGMQCI
jgi:hypothetical protein